MVLDPCLYVAGLVDDHWSLGTDKTQVMTPRIDICKIMMVKSKRSAPDRAGSHTSCSVQLHSAHRSRLSKPTRT